MLNKNFAIISIIILLLSPAIYAEDFNSPEAFTDYIYENYAAENFSEVYLHFAAELKRKLEKEDYLKFQKSNFEKYNLVYENIEVGQAEEIKFTEIENNFNYAMDFGEYYRLKVKYLLKFSHFGSREKESEKFVYLRKIKDDFQLFWDYESAIKSEKNRDDKSDQ